MTQNDIIKLAAKSAGLHVKMNIPSQNGVAILGDLSDEEMAMFNKFAVDAIAAGISEKYPAKVEKQEDGKSVDVSSFLLVFTPQMLVEFIADFLAEAKKDSALLATPAAGQG